MLNYVRYLSITNTIPALQILDIRQLAMGDIPVHDDSLRKAAVELVVSSECLGDCGTHPVSHLGKVGMEISHGDELCEGTIDAGDHGTNGLVLVKTVMVGIVSDNHRVLERYLNSPRLPP